MKEDYGFSDGPYLDEEDRESKELLRTDTRYYICGIEHTEEQIRELRVKLNKMHLGDF